MNSEFEKFLGKKILLVRIIWGAMFTSLAMLFVVISMVNKEPMDWNLGSMFSDPTSIVLTIMAALCALGALKIVEFSQNRIVRKRWNREEFIVELSKQTTDAGKTYSAQEITYFQSLTDEQLKIFRVFSSLTMAFIVSFALSEAVAIMGFLLATIHRNTAFFIPYFLVGLVLMAVSFPKFDPTKVRLS